MLSAQTDTSSHHFQLLKEGIFSYKVKSQGEDLQELTLGR